MWWWELGNVDNNEHLTTRFVDSKECYPVVGTQAELLSLFHGKFTTVRGAIQIRKGERNRSELKINPGARIKVNDNESWSKPLTHLAVWQLIQVTDPAMSDNRVRSSLCTHASQQTCTPGELPTSTTRLHQLTGPSSQNGLEKSVHLASKL